MNATQQAPTIRLGKPPSTLAEAAASFIADCRARNLSPCTITLNRIILRGLADFLGDTALSQITPADLRRFVIEKASNTSPATAARYFDCLKCFFRFLAAEGFISQNPAAGIEKPRAPVPVIEPLQQEQVEAMVSACDTRTFSGIRDRLVLLMLVDTGLRASELCNLCVNDVDLENQQLLVRHGKGGKSRRVPFGNAVLGALRTYLARRAEVDEPHLLVTVYGEPVDRYRLRAIVKNAAERAGVKHPHAGPHLLRHTAGVMYLRRGGDTFTLQKIFGHSTQHMTRRYCELADQDVQDKHRLFSPADALSRTATSAGRKKRLR